MRSTCSSIPIATTPRPSGRSRSCSRRSGFSRGWRVLDVACGAGPARARLRGRGRPVRGRGSLGRAAARRARRDRRAAGAGRHAGAADPARIDGPHGQPLHQLRLFRARRGARRPRCSEMVATVRPRRLVRDRLPESRRRARPAGAPRDPAARRRRSARSTRSVSPDGRYVCKTIRTPTAGAFTERVRLFGAGEIEAMLGGGRRHRAPALRRLRRLAPAARTRPGRSCSGRRHDPAASSPRRSSTRSSRPPSARAAWTPRWPTPSCRRPPGTRSSSGCGSPGALAVTTRAAARALHRAALHHSQGAQRRGAGAACSSDAGIGPWCRSSGSRGTTTTSPRRARRRGSRADGAARHRQPAAAPTRCAAHADVPPAAGRGRSCPALEALAGRPAAVRVPRSPRWRGSSATTGPTRPSPALRRRHGRAARLPRHAGVRQHPPVGQAGGGAASGHARARAGRRARRRPRPLGRGAGRRARATPASPWATGPRS